METFKSRTIYVNIMSNVEEIIRELDRVSTTWTTQWMPPSREDLTGKVSKKHLEIVLATLNTAPYRQSNVSATEFSRVLGFAIKNGGSGRNVFLEKYFSGVKDDKGDYIESMPTLPWDSEDYGDGYHPEREEPLGIELDPQSKIDRTPRPFYVKPIPKEELSTVSPTLYHYALLWYDTPWHYFTGSEGIYEKRFQHDFQSIAVEGKKVGNQMEKIKNIIRNGVWGKPDNNSATYVQIPNIELTTTKCGPNIAFEDPEHYPEPAIRLHVDTQRLISMRTLFYDPEAVFIGEEFKKTFMVAGGIPFEAITDFDLCPSYFKK